MNWKNVTIGILAGAFIIIGAGDASAFGWRWHNAPGYLALGASYTYGYGADGNDYGGDPRTNENPGYGYTDTVYEYLLDQPGNWRMTHLNLAIGGARSGDIVDAQLDEGVEFLQRSGSRSIVEISSGGNDLLRFMLFPQELPEDQVDDHLTCNMNTPFYDAALCDEVVSRILGTTEENLRITLDAVIDSMPRKSGIILRSFPNAISNGNTTMGPPGQEFPFPFTCEGPYNPENGQFGAMDIYFSEEAAATTGYGVAQEAPQTEHLFYGDTDTFEGLNVMIARVADEYAAQGYNVVFADIGPALSDGVFWDCIHPNDAGHDAIAEIMIDAIEDLGVIRGSGCRF